MAEVREPRMQTVRKLAALVRQGAYCAVLGPPRRGKTRLLSMLHNHLEEERRALPRHMPLSVFLDLRQRDPDKPWTLPELLNQIYAGARCPKPLPHADVFVDKDKVRDLLGDLATSIAPRLALLISPIDVAGEDVARNLLEGLNGLYYSAPERRPGLVVGGSLDLVHLTHGETSPFNVATKILLEPNTREEAASGLKDIAREAGFPNLEDQFREAILDLTDGQWDAMRMLLVRLRERSLDATVRNLETAVGELEEAFSSGRGKTSDKDGVSRGNLLPETFAPLRETLDVIEARPEWLSVVARLCSGEDPAQFGGGRHNPAMCLALRQAPRGITFSSKLFELVLKSHFTPLHIADRLVLQGRWPDARPYYQEAQATKPFGPFKARSYTLTDLAYAAFGTVSTQQGLEPVRQQVAEIARQVLGVKCACLFEGRRASSGRWDWEMCAGQTPSECPITRRLVQEWADIALRRGDPSVLNGGRVVVATIWLADMERSLALCTATDHWKQSYGQVRAAQMLLALCAKGCQESRRLAENEREIERQAMQLALARTLVKTVQSSGSVDRVVREVLKSFEEIGFPHVMVSFLDKRRNRVEARDGSGDMQLLVSLTRRKMHSEEVADDDDILVYVIKTGKTMHVPDCTDPKYRCDQYAIKMLDPPLRSQIVFPLKGRRGIGWGRTDVLGTIQVGRVPPLPLPSVQENALADLVRYASVVLTDALLSEERVRLVGVRDRQIKMMTQASLAAAHLEDVERTLTTMLEAVVGNLGAMAGSIRLYDPTFNCLVYRAVAGGHWRPEHVLIRYPADELSTAGWVYKNRRFLVNYDVSEEGVPYRKLFDDVRSNCGIPITVSNQVYGALVVDSNRVGAFTEEELRLLEAFASLTGSLMKGGHAFALDSTRSKVSQSFAAHGSWETTLRQVASIAKKAVGADHCSIFLRHDTERVKRFETTAERN